MQADRVRLSKFLSWALRHDPGRIGIRLDPHGWVSVVDLVHAARAKGVPLTAELVREIVRTCDKQRYALSPDGKRIRARQGHSVAIDLELAATEPPATLFHGTAKRFLHSILADGLQAGSRNYVHLSVDIPTALKVGERHGAAVALSVDAGAMFDRGYEFFVSENGVWLTRHVPPEFLQLIKM